MILNIKGVRNIFDTNYTVSDYFIDDIKQCSAIEDVDRGLDSSMSLKEITDIKKYGITCIPYSSDYKIGWRISQRFSNKFFYNELTNDLITFETYKLLTAIEKQNYAPHEMMWILNTKGFDFCYFHWGNTHHDTLGCIIVGKKSAKYKDRVILSKDTYIDFYKKIRPFKNTHQINLTITK